MATALIYHERFLEHDTGAGHPECSARLLAIMQRLHEDGLLDRMVTLPFEPASRAAIERVHDAAYIDRVYRACREEKPFIDSPDSAICPASAEIAQLAAGGVLAAVDAVTAGDVTNAFCAVRPPGHHAERDRSMGFCLFNNIAIGAAHALEAHGLERIAIVDFDVHHGNGTQHIFDRDKRVLFTSMHEDPQDLYPGTGFADEGGEGDAVGTTLNLPLPPGSDDATYLHAFDSRVLPALHTFEPTMLLISAGFDAAASDPLAQMCVTAEGFEAMTQRLVDAARDLCDSRIVSILEGGYDLDALSEGVARHVRVLCDA